MKKPKIDIEELKYWMDDSWHLFASWNKKDNALLRLWLNSAGMYKVTYGSDILYHGSQMTHAIAAWDSV